MEINIPKTKVMHVGAQEASPVFIHGNPIESVSTFKYLGSCCSDDLSIRPAINNRLSSAAFAFEDLKKLHDWNGTPLIDRGIKSILYKVIVQSALLFGCETWAIPEAELSRLEVFQMRCLRALCKLSLMDRVPNEEILKKCNTVSVSQKIQTSQVARSCCQDGE